MPPKNEDVRQEPLTAVLLADSFSKRMAPITAECPKVLLPLVNAPMIEYMLEWLAMSGVQIVHVLCCSHADQIREYLNTSTKWSGSDMRLNIISSYNCASAGEALRLVDQEGLIQDDFILVSGDVVTNMSLSDALSRHKARRAADKSAIMTIVATGSIDDTQRVRLGLPDLCVALDPATSRILSYTNPLDGAENGVVDLDTAFFSERDSLSVRGDLADACIYLCAPEVLVLFTDNFDFQHIQRDFIRGVLSEEELGNKLYAHVLQNEYAAHVANMRAYAAVSWDIMTRWAYPLCPDSNLLPAAQRSSSAEREGNQEPDYVFAHGCRYKESNVKADRMASVGELSCLGSGTQIRNYARVQRSVLGRGCVVGVKAQIVDSFIMSNVTIGAGAQVRSAIVCDGATVGDGAVVSEGAVISFNCVIAAGHTVPPHTRVTLCTQQAAEPDSDNEAEAPHPGGFDDDSDDGGERDYGPSPSVLQAAEQVRNTGTCLEVFDSAAVGAAGAGFDYLEQQATSLSERDLLTSVALPTVSAAASRARLLAPQAEGPVARADDEEERGGLANSDPEVLFMREVQETLLRTMLLARESNNANSSMTENAVIELNGLKIAEVRTFADCARYVLTTLMDLQAPPSSAVHRSFRGLFAAEAPDTSTNAGALQLFKGFKGKLTVWAETLQKFLRSDEDQFELLLLLEEYCSGKGMFEAVPGAGSLYVPVFSNVLAELHDLEIISKAVFTEWEEQKLQDEDEDLEFLKHAQKFLDYLKQTSEEEDSEEEDSDEDGSDDDGSESS